MNLTDYPQFQSNLHRAISEIVVDVRRSPLGLFLIDSELESVDLSGFPPLINSVQIITGRGETDKLPLSLKFDLDYEGVCALSMIFKSILGINLRVQTFINKFKGTLCLVIQDRTIHFCFLEPPSHLGTSTSVTLMTMTSGTRDAKYQIPFLNRLVSSENIIKKGLAAGPCFPNFLGQWYRAGPDQPPYPWSQSVLHNPNLLYNWAPKSD